MKKLIFFVFCSVFFFLSYSMMHVVPGEMQRPHWPNSEYEKRAQSCFNCLVNLKAKKEIKDFLENKHQRWNAILEVNDLNNESMANEIKFLEENKWEPASFVATPITLNGTQNTIELCNFFKEFTNQASKLYFEGGIIIFENTREAMFGQEEIDSNQQRQIFLKLYPTVYDIHRGKLKEARSLLIAILKCFDAP